MKILIAAFFLVFSLSLRAEKIAKIDFIQGAVSVNGELAKLPIDLQEGDTIKAWSLKKPKRTGSFVRIIFTNGDKVGLSNGSFVIEKFNTEKTIFSLLKGKFFNYAKPNLERKLEVKIKSVSVGVRGTKYMIDERKKDTYVCVCEGEVVANKGGRSTPIKAGYDLHILPGKPINQSVEATQDMIKMLAQNFSLLGEPVNLNGDKQ